MLYEIEFSFGDNNTSVHIAQVCVIITKML